VAGIGLALLAAVSYGSADFLGGIASRRLPAAVVVVSSQVAGLALLVTLLPLVPGHFHASDLGWGLAAGVFGAVGIGALYAALAVGRMGLVSPVTAVVGASVPVVWGLLSGERPGATALLGVGLAFIAVVLVSTNVETGRISPREPGIGLALVSGLAIGLLYVLLAQAHRDSGLTILAAGRFSSIPLLAAWALAKGERLFPPRSLWGTLALTGGLDMGANVLYVLSARVGLVSIAAVLTSLYPAATVFLARVVLGERLSAVQWAGVGCAAAGVALIAV